MRCTLIFKLQNLCILMTINKSNTQILSLNSNIQIKIQAILSCQTSSRQSNTDIIASSCNSDIITPDIMQNNIAQSILIFKLNRHMIKKLNLQQSASNLISSHNDKKFCNLNFRYATLTRSMSSTNSVRLCLISSWIHQSPEVFHIKSPPQGKHLQNT